MFVLGITGGIGSGKSTVSGLLAERGLLVLDADEISRSVTGPMGRAMPEIAETFGKIESILRFWINDELNNTSMIAEVNED